MKNLSCDEADFISLSCESIRVTYETSKRDGYVSYIWRCSPVTRRVAGIILMNFNVAVLNFHIKHRSTTGLRRLIPLLFYRHED
jgi:hypothetical protein